MKRRIFIEILFNNGQGLTLEQIRYIETDALKEIIPDDIIGNVDTETAFYMARDVFMDNLKDNEDLLELKDYLEKVLLESGKETSKLTDSQIYHLWYAVA